MEKTTKITIVEALKSLSNAHSQNKLAKMAGVSSATISQMINGKWDLIADEMWRKVHSNLRMDLSWNTAATANFSILSELLGGVQMRSLSIAISNDAGTGKSHAYKAYALNFVNVIYIECKNYWSKKSYARNLLTACGLNDSGTTEELIERFIRHLKTLQKPIVILDQADKLKDNQMDLFMDFYNELESSCGFVLSGVPALEKRIKRGVQHDKIGYSELWSRVGRKFISLAKISFNDVSAICIANGLNDQDEIKRIYNSCEGDLRRVRRDVEKYFLIQNAA